MAPIIRQPNGHTPYGHRYLKVCPVRSDGGTIVIVQAPLAQSENLATPQQMVIGAILCMFFIDNRLVGKLFSFCISA